MTDRNKVIKGLEVCIGEDGYYHWPPKEFFEIIDNELELEGEEHEVYC